VTGISWRSRDIHVGFEVLTPVVIKTAIFCSTLKVKPKDLSPAFELVSCSTYSTLKMEAICSSETSTDFQRTTRRYIKDDSILQETFRSSAGSCSESGKSC
jgi:hypothetical protein